VVFVDKKYGCSKGYPQRNAAHMAAFICGYPLLHPYFLPQKRTTPRCSIVVHVIPKFKVCKSVHHRIIQINHQPDATVFQFIILTFIYSSTCFGRFPPIIRSSMTAVTASGFIFLSW
jgi:hypothetical protein